MRIYALKYCSPLTDDRLCHPMPAADPPRSHLPALAC